MRMSVASGASTMVMSAMRPSRKRVDARALAFHADQQLQEQRVLDPRPVALPFGFARQRRAQLLVELRRGAGEQHQHHQEIEMEDEIEQRRDDIERQQLDLDVEDRQRLRLAQQQIAMGGRQRRDGEIEREAEEREPQRLKPLGRAVQRSEQRVELLGVRLRRGRTEAPNRSGQRLMFLCPARPCPSAFLPASICV